MATKMDLDEGAIDKLTSRFQDLTVAADVQKTYSHLPTEIIIQVLEEVSQNANTQSLLHSACLVSRAWYSAGVAILYRYPRLSGKNFMSFVRTVCPSVNAHVRKSELAFLVEVLDMGDLVHDGSKSLTARLLSRTKGQLKAFVAPRATFAINSFAALTKCSQLHTLDLTLISSALSLQSLFKTLSVLPTIRRLHFPRSIHKEEGYDPSTATWPPNLESLRLGGNLASDFLYKVSNFPPTLHELAIEQCTYTAPVTIFEFIRRLGAQLTSLDLSFYHGTDPFLAVDRLLLSCRALRTISVPVELFGVATFRAFTSIENQDFDHPLETMKITMSASVNGSFSRAVMGPQDLAKAVDRGLLPNLKTVKIDSTLGWHIAETAPISNITVPKLDDLTKIAAILAEDHGGEEGVGVWITQPNIDGYNMTRP